MVTRSLTDRTGADRWLQPRDDVVRERPCGDGRFEAAEGPVTRYERVVELEHRADGRVAVTSTTHFTLALPYVAWLLLLPTKHELRRPPGARTGQPWWAPPARLDPRAASVLGVLVAASVVGGYLGTLLSQTITYAAAEFGADDRAQGATLAAVRVGVLLALVLVSVADRRGRRLILLVSAGAGCVVAATGALAPSMAALGVSQTVSRAFATALALLITIVAVEEVPAGARAYAVSVLGMSAALGAGFCVMALPLADLGEPAWRLLYLGPLLGLPLTVSVARRLPESRRFGLPHAATSMAGHRGRLTLLATSTALLYLFSQPASQFLNEFLRTERDFSAARIALFTVATSTPGGIGVVVGGRLADVRGRRIVAAVGLAGGTGCTVLMYLTDGWSMWVWSLVGTILAGAVIPAMGVYGPELFPTSLRGRANGYLAVAGVVGGATGLVLTGTLSERFDGLGPAISLLGLGSLVVVVLVLALFPETSQRELEQLNPEDAPPPPVPGPGLLS